MPLRGVPARRCFSLVIPGAHEQQWSVYAMQDASRYAPVEHPGKTGPPVTGHGNQIRPVAVRGAHDLINHGASDDIRLSLNALATKLVLESSKVRFCVLLLLLKLLMGKLRIVSPLGPHNNAERIDDVQEHYSGSATQAQLLNVGQYPFSSLRSIQWNQYGLVHVYLLVCSIQAESTRK